MIDLSNDIVQKIYDIYKQKGYVSENVVFNLIIDSGIPLDETDRVIDKLLSMGVLIQDEPVIVQTDDVDSEDDVDRTQLDYEEIYKRVLEIDPSLDFIIDYVRQIPAPKTHEVANLMKQAKSGNEYAKNRVIELLLKVAIKMALNFAERYHTELDETIQYAFEGLVIAYEKFEIGRQDNFTTYAPWWIRQNLHRTIDLCSGLHTPAHLDEKLMTVKDALNNHFCDECLTCDICPNLVQYLCTEMSVSSDTVNSYIAMMEDSLSIDELVENECPELMSWTNNELIDEISYWDLCDKIQDVLLTLKPRESRVLTLKYGLDDNVEKTLEEVGKSFGVTRERIRQIEAMALRKLRHPSRSKKLKDYYDIDFPIILAERYEQKIFKHMKVKESEYNNSNTSPFPDDEYSQNDCDNFDLDENDFSWENEE